MDDKLGKPFGMDVSSQYPEELKKKSIRREELFKKMEEDKDSDTLSKRMGFDLFKGGDK